MKNKSIVVLEITDTHIKLLKAKRQPGGPVISYCFVQDLANNAEQTLEQFLSQASFSRKEGEEDLYIVLPRRNVFLKQMNFPSHQEEEIKKMLSLQLSTHVPYSREDIISDCFLLEKNPEGYTKAVVVAVSKKVVNRYLNVILKQGILSFRFVVSAFGILDWFLYQEKRIRRKEEGPTVILNVEQECSEVCFYHRKKLLFSRHISIGVAGADDDLTELMSQIALTLEAYKTEKMGMDIQRMIILSSSEGVVFLKQKLEEYYEVPIEILKPEQNIVCEKKVDLSALQKEKGVSLASCLGFILQETPHAMNLVPKEVLDMRKVYRRKQLFFQFVLILFVTSILVISIFGFGIYQKMHYLQKIEAKIGQIEAGSKKAEQKIQFFNFIKKTIQSRVLVVDVIEELYKLTPPEISFRSLQFDQRGALSIQGFADTGGSVNYFQNQLVRSPLFNDVTLQYATKRRKFKEEYTDFRIKCHMAIKTDSSK